MSFRDSRQSEYVYYNYAESSSSSSSSTGNRRIVLGREHRCIPGICTRNEHYQVQRSSASSHDTQSTSSSPRDSYRSRPGITRRSSIVRDSARTRPSSAYSPERRVSEPRDQPRPAHRSVHRRESPTDIERPGVLDILGRIFARKRPARRNSESHGRQERQVARRNTGEVVRPSSSSAARPVSRRGTMGEGRSTGRSRAHSITRAGDIVAGSSSRSAGSRPADNETLMPVRSHRGTVSGSRR